MESLNAKVGARKMPSSMSPSHGFVSHSYVSHDRQCDDDARMAFLYFRAESPTFLVPKLPPKSPSPSGLIYSEAAKNGRSDPKGD